MGNNMSFRREFGLIVVGAIVLTASLMWKDFLMEVGENHFPRGHGLAGRLFYTTLVTLILVWIAVHLKTVWGLNGAPISIDAVPDHKDTAHIDATHVDTVST
jgi:hypothetical protein